MKLHCLQNMIQPTGVSTFVFSGCLGICIKKFVQAIQFTGVFVFIFFVFLQEKKFALI